jgi:23S rRNA (guanosine2251-2'-O)-methyltransferase
VSQLLGIHVVEEALRAGRPLDRIVIARGRHGTRMEEIVSRARKQGVPVRFEDRSQLDRLAGSREHQGVVAIAASRATMAVDDLLGENSGSSLLVLLDGVEDPHNVGAIVRTALASGADGLVIPERRAAGLTETVARASAGALEHLPVARVTNLVRSMEQLKEKGYWLIGLDETAKQSYTEMDYTGAVGIVLGGEGNGLHELTRKRCDFLAAIPTKGPVRSLNVSVAAGVVLFEAVRQRNEKAKQK